MLHEKYAVVTGGSDGIGYAIAERFAQNGAHVCLIGRDLQKLKQAVLRLSVYNTTVVGVDFDLFKVSEIKDLIVRILKAFPRIDVLVNNAGLGVFVPFLETDAVLLEQHLSLNVKTPYFLTQGLLPALFLSKGCVINISSYFSHRMLVGRDTTAYSLTKGAMDSFTRALAFEVGKKGIRVNAIAPGSIETPQLLSNLERLDQVQQSAFHDMVKEIYPLGKIGSGEDVAEMAVFLASEKAKWITGAVVAVDGGLTTN